MLRSVGCDALAVSGGWSPRLHLYTQAGGKLAFDHISGTLLPVSEHRSFEIVGAATTREPVGPRLSPVGNTRGQWADLLHDVTVADVELALLENYSCVEHVKRYSTAGMAPDHGKTSSTGVLTVVAELREFQPGSLATPRCGRRLYR